MKNKYLIVPLLLLFAAVVLNARPGWRGMEQGRIRHGRAMTANRNSIPVQLLLSVKEKIGLSAEQEKRLRAMKQSHEQWLIQSRADMELKTVKLRGILEAEPLNLKDAEGLIREQAGMSAELQIACLRFQQDVKALLSAEQLAKVSEMKKEFGTRVREGMRQRSEHRRERMN